MLLEVSKKKEIFLVACSSCSINIYLQQAKYFCFHFYWIVNITILHNFLDLIARWKSMFNSNGSISAIKYFDCKREWMFAECNRLILISVSVVDCLSGILMRPANPKLSLHSSVKASFVPTILFTSFDLLAKKLFREFYYVERKD